MAEPGEPLFDLHDPQAAALFVELAATARADVRRRLPLHGDDDECTDCVEADNATMDAAEAGLRAFCQLDGASMDGPLTQLTSSPAALLRGAAFFAAFVRAALGVQANLDPGKEWRGMAAPSASNPSDMEIALPLAFLDGYMAGDLETMASSGLLALEADGKILGDFIGVLAGQCAARANDALLVRNGRTPAQPVHVIRVDYDAGLFPRMHPN